MRRQACNSDTSGVILQANTRPAACVPYLPPASIAAIPLASQPAAGALRQTPNGIVEHVRTRCIGCGYCIQTCPFHVPRFSPAQHTMRKCSFCIHRVDSGREPACVSKCTTGALTYYPDSKRAAGLAVYGNGEHLHMVYRIEGKPGDYSLPEPVPLNTVASNQLWKWLAGLLPGGLLLAWLWKSVDQEKDHE